jgi:predicted outer membrane lipoprotein
VKQSSWREALSWLGTKPFLALGFLLLSAATGIYNVIWFALHLEARAKAEKQVKGD